MTESTIQTDNKTCENCVHYNEFSIYQDNCEAPEYCVRDNHGEASGATKDLWKSNETP